MAKEQVVGPKRDMIGPYEKYEVESWARTITESEEIKADPEKMKYVRPMLAKKYRGLKNVINTIEDIKARKEMMDEEEMDDEMEDDAEE